MRRFLLMVFVLCSLNVFAFHFGRSVGKKVEFCAYRFEDQYFLILQFEDDDNCRLTQSAIVKFKLKDGSVIRLSGFDSSQKTEHGYGMGIGTLNGSSTDTHFAVLPISKEDVERLKIGVNKIAINSIPEVYMRDSWANKSKFGQQLYEDFQKLKDEFGE